MNNYNDYIEERMIGMYNVHNSVILEGFKDKKKGSKGELKGAFINYLVFKYEDNDIRYDYKNAKTDEQKLAFAKKYADDYAEWKKRQKGLTAIIATDLVALGISGALPAVGELLLFLSWGGLIHAVVKDYSIREKRREEDYNKKHKK